MKEKKDVVQDFRSKPPGTLFCKSGASDRYTPPKKSKAWINPVRYCRIPLAVMIDKSLSMVARCVYGLLSVAVFQGNISVASVRVMASQLGVGKDTIRRGLKELIAGGHIQHSGFKRGSKPHYELLSPVFGKKQGALEEVHITTDGSRKRLVSVEQRRPA